jgi:hypothetical protein
MIPFERNGPFPSPLPQKRIAADDDYPTDLEVYSLSLGVGICVLPAYYKADRSRSLLRICEPVVSTILSARAIPPKRIKKSNSSKKSCPFDSKG